MHCYFGLLGVIVDFIDGLLKGLEAGSVPRVSIPTRYQEVIPTTMSQISYTVCVMA